MWFKNLFKKEGKKMIASEKIENMKARLSSFSKYQWIKSERAGNITEFLNIAVEQDGGIWVEFVDGSRIKYELLDEFILKTNNEHELLEITHKEKPTVGNVSVRTPTISENPIHTLLKKQKPNPVSIDITLNLNIPSAELYNVICQSFDNADEEIVNYIVSGLNVDTIKESVKEAIKKHYID